MAKEEYAADEHLHESQTLTERSENTEPETGENTAPPENGGRPPLQTKNGSRPPFQKTSLWIDLMAIVGVFIVTSLIGGLIGGLVVSTANAEQAFASFLSTAISLGITIVFAVWLRIRHGSARPLLSFSFRNSNPSVILWGLVLVLATSVVLEPLLELFPDVNMELVKKAVGTGGWAMLTVIVLAPVLEETLFRGIIQGAAVSEYGRWRGVLIASAIFGVVHIIPQMAINAFFIGIILGYIYLKSGSLIPVIIIHAVNNALAYILMMTRDDKSVATIRSIMENDTWYWIVYGLCAAIFLAACFGIWFHLNKKDNPDS